MQTRSQSKQTAIMTKSFSYISQPSSPVTRSQVKSGDYSHTNNKWTIHNKHLLPGITTRSGLVLSS